MFDIKHAEYSVKTLFTEYCNISTDTSRWSIIRHIDNILKTGAYDINLSFIFKSDNLVILDIAGLASKSGPELGTCKPRLISQ